MAENESLDLDDPYGRRWGILVRSIRKHESFDTVFGWVRNALYGGPRNALKQVEKYGVTLQMLLENRNSPRHFVSSRGRPRGTTTYNCSVMSPKPTPSWMSQVFCKPLLLELGRRLKTESHTGSWGAMG